ncbi:hypothetical protein ABIF93_011250 [Bradyrhizobium japonicum]
MLDCLAMLAHRLYVCIKALLHGLEQSWPRKFGQ